MSSTNKGILRVLMPHTHTHTHTTANALTCENKGFSNTVILHFGSSLARACLMRMSNQAETQERDEEFERRNIEERGARQKGRKREKGVCVWGGVGGSDYLLLR